MKPYLTILQDLGIVSFILISIPIAFEGTYLRGLGKAQGTRTQGLQKIPCALLEETRVDPV